MATVHIALATTRSKRTNGDRMPVVEAAPVASETITSSSSNQKTTTVAGTYPGAEFWVVTAVDGNILIAAGDDPDATSDDTHYVLAGQTREFAANTGEKLAVVDA